LSVPTTTEVAHIAAIADPVVRNLQITQCYYELSQAMTARVGTAANWCTFATWASKQAGQTIRGEDLQRAAQDLVLRSAELHTVFGLIASVTRGLGGAADGAAVVRSARDALAASRPLRRSSEAVTVGNRKVFEEIGREFARFLATPDDAVVFDAEATARFGAALRPGQPPEGQQLLRDAFAAYAEARFLVDADAQAERIFYANLLVGLHEQTRLQPEIAAALDAALTDAEAVREQLLARLLPGVWRRTRHRVARLFGRRPPLDEALDRLVAVLRRELRRLVTESLMTLRISDEVALRLGRDLEMPFPEALRQITYPPLRALLARVDPTPDSVLGSGARDWADLAQRMHFIADLFRCFHAWPTLFREPFTADQVEAFSAGKRPEGML
jgi:hypothetical protein